MFVRRQQLTPLVLFLLITTAALADDQVPAAEPPPATDGPASSQTAPEQAAPSQPAADTAEREDPAKIQSQVIDRLTKLSEFLGREADKAEQEAVQPLERAMTIDEVDYSLISAERAGSVVTKQVLDDEALPDVGERLHNFDDRKQILTERIEQRTTSFRRYADEYKQLAEKVAAAPAEQALDLVQAVDVPPEIRKVLEPSAEGLPQVNETGTRAFGEEPARSIDEVAAANVNPLQVFVSGDERIAGSGGRASVDYPAVALLLTQGGDQAFAPSCTGTLIAPNVILSAAHCFCMISSSQNYRQGGKCKAGTFKRSGEEVPALSTHWRRAYFQHRGMVEIERVEVHDDYDFPYADLSLVYLKTPIFDIEPAPINSAGPLPLESVGMIVGFGRRDQTDESGIPSAAASMKLANHGLKYLAKIATGPCRSASGHDTKPLICWTYDSKLAIATSGTTCDGDSGGPLFVILNGTFVLAGVTSGGTSPAGVTCGDGDYAYDVDVFSFRDWITQRIAAAPPTAGPSETGSILSAFVNPETNYIFAIPHRRFPKTVASYQSPFQIFANNQKSIRIGLNSTRSISGDPLYLKITDPSGVIKCEMSTYDTAALCEVPNPVKGKWSLEVKGPPLQEFQFIATTF